MSIQTEPTTTESTETYPAAGYSALEHTITVDGGWPVCAGCGEPESHEQCVAAEHRADQAIHGRAARRRPGVVFDPETVRAWLDAEDPDEPGEQRADRWLTYPGEDESVNVEDAERLVHEAGRAGLFGPDVWIVRAVARPGTRRRRPRHRLAPHRRDHHPGARRGGAAVRGQHVGGDLDAALCPTHDPSGIKGLVAVLGAVAADATEVLDRSLSAVTTLCRGPVGG